MSPVTTAKDIPINRSPINCIIISLVRSKELEYTTMIPTVPIVTMTLTATLKTKMAMEKMRVWCRRGRTVPPTRAVTEGQKGRGPGGGAGGGGH